MCSKVQYPYPIECGCILVPHSYLAVDVANEVSTVSTRVRSMVVVVLLYSVRNIRRCTAR